ncbi:MAG: hypothetical protein KDA49_11295, partial [Rhodospirillaceae bacterium]|nr:hypothetical protein [Rhodospirillaceae bacterium]
VRRLGREDFDADVHCGSCGCAEVFAGVYTKLIRMRLFLARTRQSGFALETRRRHGRAGGAWD